ncbi:sugar phosphorylase [Candidatus Roizmanbacteria bacterium]|nr:sugar phosphorylase [Candidatus Roizmanbacteria bacterium]
MLEKLIFLYGEEKAKEVEKKLKKIIDEVKAKIVCEDRAFWDEKDIFLITYADSFQEIDSGQVFRQVFDREAQTESAQDTKQSRSARMTTSVTLKTLSKFLDLHLKGAISGVHILPFFPYSSDRGFSVMDYNQVKKEFGSWGDVQEIGKNYRLMADLVLNHVSVKHDWFQKFLAGDEKYWNYFIHFEKSNIPHEALKKVFRPRFTSLLSPFQTARGERWVWTTFSVENSTDQVDLNYHNPEVLIEIIRVLLNLLAKSIRVFRLDAVAYIWKKLGTDCKNLPEGHAVVSLFRNILDLVCPSAIIITETNVPYEDNITYFGDGQNESQMVYNFSLPPLILNAFYTGKANHLTSWAKMLKSSSDKTTFFNFLSTHDGIGILGAKGILPENQIELLLDQIIENGGKLSERILSTGERTVYEMNSTWWSALNRKDEMFESAFQKFLTSIAICLALAGVPALYYHLFFGTENNLEGYKKTRIKRDINRKNLNLHQLEKILANKETKEIKVFSAVCKILRTRSLNSAFHPNSKQEILELDNRIFAVLRGEDEDRVLALHNVSRQKVEVKFEDKTYVLEPYGFKWVSL